MDKQEIRNAILKERKALLPQEKIKADSIITETVIHEISNVKSIGIYVSLEDEVNTKEIIEYCFFHQIDVVVPRVNGTSLSFHKIESFDDLQPSIFNLLEPITNCIYNIQDLDRMYVPLVAFDSYYHRIGYGKGFYDSILKYYDGPKIGLAYKIQQVKKIIPSAFDVTLDRVITEV